MVLDAYREAADRFLEPLARSLRTANPNALSWAALCCALGAGILLAVGGGWALAVGSLMVLLNAVLDALDGKVAKATGRASARGDLLDHVLDRYADVFILGGIAFSPYCPPTIGFLAILGALLTSYMGTQAQAVGLGRHYGGLLGRADRVVLVVGALILQAAIDPAGRLLLGAGATSLTLLGWTMAAIAVLGNLTAVQRAARTWKLLAAK